MTLAARLIAMQSSVRLFGRGANQVWRFGRPRDVTAQWMLGITAIVIAATLFLASALSLGLMLNHLRTQMQIVEHTQMLVDQTRSIEGDLSDAKDAARLYRQSGNGADAIMVRIEGRNAVRHLQALADVAPGESVALKSIGLLVNDELAALSRGGSNDGANRALAAFRAKQSAAHQEYRASADRDIVSFIALALIMALIGPALGLIGITLLQRDRSNRHARELQSELMHVQRLAVMGETAAMLAHEVSHPLAAASNYLAALRRSSANGDCAKAAEFSDRAAKQIHRAATILHRLRRFIEKRDAERTPVAPAILIQDAIALLGPLDGDVDLETLVDPELPFVAIDRIQIQQVLVNLIRNAVEAMRGSAVRRLVIGAAEIAPRQIEFRLIDTGPGLKADIAAKLFQPFVTSKKDGMGVGLSICRSIIADHDGVIWAEPNPQGGTVFRFRLPAA